MELIPTKNALLCLFFLGVLLWGTQSPGMDEKTFNDTLSLSLKKSVLTSVQKAQHILNRMGYGANPLSVSQKISLLSQSDSKIIEFINSQLKNLEDNRPDAASDVANKVFAQAAFIDGESNYVHAEKSLEAEKDKQRKIILQSQMDYWDKMGFGHSSRNFIFTFDSNQNVTTHFFSILNDLYARHLSITNNINELTASLKTIQDDEKKISIVEKINQYRQDQVKYGVQIAAISGVTSTGARARQVARALVDEDHSLRYQLSDFWFNHFNVATSVVGTAYLLEHLNTVENHMTGTFYDLLTRVAQSPAMLKYLNNDVSGKIFKTLEALANTNCYKKKGDALIQCVDFQLESLLKGQIPYNENYARELLELHTLGVGPGLVYNQTDVQEAAKILTGWSVDLTSLPYKFKFLPEYHRSEAHQLFCGTNNCLLTIGPGTPSDTGQDQGQDQGVQLLSFLSSHQLTAENISRKLARRFVSENAEFIKPLVGDLSDDYNSNNGNLLHLYRALFSSPQFWSPESFKSKAVRPFDNHVRMARALGIPVDMGNLMTEQLVSISKAIVDRMNADGYLLFDCLPPTGYPDDSKVWQNPATVIGQVINGFRLEEIAYDPNLDPTLTHKLGWERPLTMSSYWTGGGRYFLPESQKYTVINDSEFQKFIAWRYDFDISNSSINVFASQKIPNLEPYFDLFKSSGRVIYLPQRTIMGLKLGSEENAYY
jgi:uncharacterized protein (DUF1800 family)